MGLFTVSILRLLLSIICGSIIIPEFSDIMSIIEVSSVAMTKEEAKEAFRTVMAENYSDVPPKEALDHEFSPGFEEKIRELIIAIKKDEVAPK